MSQGSNPIFRFFSAIWRGVDAGRRFAVNLLFLAIVAGILYLVFRDDAILIEEGTALVIAPYVEPQPRTSSGPLSGPSTCVAG